jgi:hypothetical protein
MSLYALPGPLYAPLHRTQEPGNPSPGMKHRILVDISQVEIDTIGMKRLSLSGDATAGISESTLAATKHDQHLKIQIKEARIDFHKLVRPSSARGAQKSLLTCRTPRSGRLQCRRLQKIQAEQLDSYESALEFELVISFVGRTYSTKRSLQQIAQLRQDLVQDLQVQQQWTERRNRKTSLDDSSSCTSQDCSLASSTTNESSISSTCSRVVIPDLPRMSDEIMGVYGWGFVQMCGMLHSYRPALERWFHRIIANVSEHSPALSHFLWEPLSAKCIDELHSGLTELGPIDE